MREFESPKGFTTLHRMEANSRLWCRVDLKLLSTSQQLYLYFVPMFTNLGFVNVLVVIVRLSWFRKHLKESGEYLIDISLCRAHHVLISRYLSPDHPQKCSQSCPGQWTRSRNWLQGRERRNI